MDADEDKRRLPLAVWDIILYGPASQREDDYIFIHIRIGTYILQPFTSWKCVQSELVASHRLRVKTIRIANREEDHLWI